MTQNITPIVFITSDEYSLPTGIAIQSLIANKNTETSYNIYVITNQVSNKNIDRLQRLETETAKINIIKYSGKRLKKYKIPSYVSTSTLIRFEVAEMFEEHDKIVYLDSDILVKKDLSCLLNLDVEDFYVAAARDMVGELNVELQKLVEKTVYFNSGVLVMNLKKIRADFSSELFFKTLDEHPDFISLSEQNVFNYLFDENFRSLDISYNLMMINLLNRNYTIKDVNNFFGTNFLSFDDLENKAFILHLTNAKKPWLYKNVFMSSEWAFYHEMSPFKDVKIKYLDDNIFEFKILNIKLFEFIRIDKNSRINFFSVPVFKKEKDDLVSNICVLGLPIYKSIILDNTLTKYFLGIRFSKKFI